MKLYLCTTMYSAEDVHVGTLAEARAWARALPRDQLFDLDPSVQAVEIATDKANILRLANIAGGTHKYLPERYTVTSRGALVRAAE